MDNTIMREQMEAIRAKIARHDEELKALKDMLRGYEAWFRLQSMNDTQQLRMPVSNRSRPKGSISFLAGCQTVLQQAHGEALVDTEIWERMQRLGVQSNAKKPVAWIAILPKRDPRIEKLDSHTFRWNEDMKRREVETHLEE